MDIESIFLDLDDTLYDFSAASRQSFQETYELLGYSRYFQSFDEYMNIYTPRNLELWEEYGKGMITKEELNLKRYSHPLEVVGVHDQELAMRFCHEALGRIPYKKCLIPGAIELLEYLHPKYNLFILSNGFQELQSKKMETAGLTPYFKDLILSDYIGINKPRRELFEYALKRTNSELGKSIMIGDMFDTDIKGAAGIGMKQIYLNRTGKSSLPFTPTFEVTSLEEIKNIL